MFYFKKNKVFPLIFSSPNKNYSKCECSICLNKIINEQPLPCGHIFHFNCVLDWFNKDLSCPICRERFMFKIKK